MNKTVKWILIGLGVVIAGLIAAKAFTGSNNEGIKVTVENVSRRTIVETVTASGKVYPEVEVKVSPDISGEITELNVQEGDSVKKDRCWPVFMRISIPRSETRRPPGWPSRRQRWRIVPPAWKH